MFKKTRVERHPIQTVQPVGPLKTDHQTLPEFIRLPKTGDRCPFTGLSRATLNELILGSAAPVKSVVLRGRGSTRGIRLIITDSLFAYLHSLEQCRGGHAIEQKDDQHG